MRTMAREKKVSLFVEIPESLKVRLQALADLRSRKMTAEVILALRRYLEEEESKEGIESDDD